MSHRMCAFGKTPIQIARIIRKGVWVEYKVDCMAVSKSKIAKKKKASNHQETPEPEITINKEIIPRDIWKNDQEEELIEFISHSWLQFAEGRPKSGAEPHFDALETIFDPPSFAAEITPKTKKKRRKSHAMPNADKTNAPGKVCVAYCDEPLSPALKDFKPFDLDSFAKSSRRVLPQPPSSIVDISERCKNGNKHVRPSTE